MNKFEWDENKRRLNIEKHHIDFIDAIAVFNDINRIEKIEMHESGEERHITIGELDGMVVFVVHALRGKSIRLISARRASKNERKYYK